MLLTAAPNSDYIFANELEPVCGSNAEAGAEVSRVWRGAPNLINEVCNGFWIRSTRQLSGRCSIVASALRGSVALLNTAAVSTETDAVE